MENILNQIENKVNTKYLIYLVKGSYEVYTSIKKEISNVPKDFLDNKIFEVLDSSKIDGEELFLIGVDNKELGWVATKKPLMILNSFEELVTPIYDENNSVLNDLLNIESNITKGNLYKVKYISNYKDCIFAGVENEFEFLGFFPIDMMDFGEIEEIGFSFNDDVVDVYKNYEMKDPQNLIADKREYMTRRIYKHSGIGVTKIGKNIFWFKLNDTNINKEDVKIIEKNIEEYYLEHLLRSLQIEKSIKKTEDTSAEIVNSDFLKNIQDRSKQLKLKNIEHLENNRKLQKQLQQNKLELIRKNSKLDYYDRLNSRNEKKMEYYKERNEKLEVRVKLLKDKLETLNKKHKEIKNSTVGKFQSKFLGK